MTGADARGACRAVVAAGGAVGVAVVAAGGAGEGVGDPVAADSGAPVTVPPSSYTMAKYERPELVAR